MKNILNNKYILIISLLIVGIIIGWFIKPSNNIESSNHPTIQSSNHQKWTCSMHPQVRKNEPGQCPLCGMDLIPMNAGEGNGGPLEIKMSPTAMQLANVVTAIVKKKMPQKEIRLNGKVKVDERKMFAQSSHIPGRIEKLMVSFTGEKVEQGQVLAYVYSPELVTAQEELFEAYKIKDKHGTLFEASKEKLKNWKLSDQQIEEILKSKKIQEHFPVLADVSGVVMKKNIQLGDYIKKGQSLFQVADLSSVWVLFDIYENDMAWVKKGDVIEFEVQSLPGEVFNSKINFIDPVIDPKLRVAKARIEVENISGRLKPDMFAKGKVKRLLSKKEKAIVIPKTAIMWTGKRSIVYVKNSSNEAISFKMREVVLGVRLGEEYLLKEGLEEGEEIAIHGTFSIDAAAQLAGKPSMMNPNTEAVDKHNVHQATKSFKVSKEAKQSLRPLIESYMLIKNALVNDQFEHWQHQIEANNNALKNIDMRLFKGDAHGVWMESNKKLESVLKLLKSSKDITSARKHFKAYSDEMLVLMKTFGTMDKTVFVQRCPMANNDKGADWLSFEKEIRNPYFGMNMLKCGEVKMEIK